MELRSCNHLHFIQAIQGGLMTKILNVTRGRPALSFKTVIDLYDNFTFDNNNVKVERSCICVTENRTVKTEPDASSCDANVGDDERNCVLEDCSFGNITLKQIKDRCKTRKRKHSQGLDSSKRKTKIEASSSLDHNIKNHVAEDDSEFMETLSSWKSKLSKNMKAKKRKCKKDPVSNVTREGISVVKSEVIQNSQESSLSCGDSAALVGVKFEVPEIDCLDYLQMLSNINSNFPACHRPEDAFGIVATEEHKIARECMLENKLNDKWKDHADLNPIQMAQASSMDILANNSELSNDKSLNFPAIQFESEDFIIQSDLHLICPQPISLAEDHNTDIYYNKLNSDTPVTLSNVGTNKSHHCVDLGNGGDGAFFSDCSKVEFTSDADTQAKLSSVSEHSLNSDGCQVCSSDDSPESEEKQLLASVNGGDCTFSSDCSKYEFNSDAEVPAKISSVIEHSFSSDECLVCSSDDSPESEEKQWLASVNGGDCTFSSDCSKDEFNSDAEVPAKISSVIEHRFNSDECLVCSSDDSPESEEKQLLASVNGDDSPESEEKQFLASVNVDEEKHVNEAANELISLDGYKGSPKLHGPQRLLSARKAISPSSQVRLCKAMQSIDLRDKDYLTCREKLYFGEKTDEKKGTTEGLNEITRARFTKSCNKFNMKPKTLKIVSHHQGVLQSSHPLRSAARFSSGHIAMQSCAKNAISFSKRQMHEAECLAMKLTNEMMSMKDIMADILRSEFCLNTSLRYKVNEARMAVKNAKRAEETAKRSLSTMARDCSRFCKLMQLADDGPPASQDVVRKKSKKIAFADETGGRLCQVKFYEDEGVSLLETERKEMLP